MADNELVYIPQPATWLKNETFWMGVGSSLIAGAVLWLIIHNVYSTDKTVDDDDAKDDEKNNVESVI
jgi:hypothetical protein